MKCSGLVFLALATLSFVGCKSAPEEAAPASSVVAQPESVKTPAAIADMKDPSAKLDRAIELALNTVYFDFDSSTLTAPALENLGHMADALVQLPEARISIEAHSDMRGSNEYNLALSQKRSESIRDFLVGRGVKSEALELKAFGEEKPAVEGMTEEAFAKNRRGEFKRLK